MKIKRFIVSIIFTLALCGLAFPQAPIGIDKIKEIKLLEANRDEVLKLLASYTLDARVGNHYDRFSTPDAEIKVEYSQGNCEEFRTDGFEVPEWKAIQVEIEPNNPIKLKDLKINLSNYKKEKRFHDIDNLYVYYDKQAGIIFTVDDNEITTIEFIPPPKYYNLMCDKEKARKLSATTSIFDIKLKERTGRIYCAVANATDLKLSRKELIAGCDLPASEENRNCSDAAKTIDISTTAVDPENDVLTYSYTVSVGKIIGTGAKVLWDLRGVKAGTYTITAAVDDGCGFCGSTQTKTVVVKECSKCR